MKAMEFLSEYLQVLVTLAVILGTAVIAGICDSLRTNNENLRAELIEMQVRLEGLDTARTAPATTARVRQPAQAPTEGDKGTHSGADDRRPPRASRMRRATAAVGRETRRAPSADALAVMQQGLQMAGVETGASTMTAASKPGISAVPRDAIEPARRTEEPPRDAETLATSDAKAATAAPSATEQDAAVMAKTTSVGRTLVPGDVQNPPTNRPSIPAGFQDGYVLTQLVQAHQPVSGLVVSVGVTPGPAENGKPPSGNIEQMIRSLLGSEDFAAQSAENEYLLIFPNQRGAAAQRKLSEVTQQLWDYQIRSAETYSILFSWGGIEVNAEAIDEAIASANERMRHTKRNRAAMTVRSASPGALRQAG